jgi:hypothetical protein
VPNRYPQSDRSAWWPYIQANCFELFTAVLAIVASISYFWQPENLSNSSIGHVQFPDVFWNSLYGLGAIFVALGLLRLSIRIEAVGLSLFTAAVAINAIAIYHYRGLSAASSLAIFVAFGLASLVRLHTLFSRSKT